MKTPFLFVLAAVPMAWVAADTPAAPPAPAPPGFEASPAPVRATILKEAGSGRVEKVRAVRRGEHTLYLADVDLPGDFDLKLQLKADGELVRRTEEMSVDALPKPVREAMLTLAGEGGLIDEVKKIIEKDVMRFKAEIDRPGKPELDVTLAPDGSVLEQKEEKD